MAQTKVLRAGLSALKLIIIKALRLALVKALKLVLNAPKLIPKPSRNNFLNILSLQFKL